MIKSDGGVDVRRPRFSWKLKSEEKNFEEQLTLQRAECGKAARSVLYRGVGSIPHIYSTAKGI